VHRREVAFTRALACALPRRLEIVRLEPDPLNGSDARAARQEDEAVLYRNTGMPTQRMRAGRLDDLHERGCHATLLLSREEERFHGHDSRQADQPLDLGLAVRR
jgi:hypothetical protein